MVLKYALVAELVDAQDLKSCECKSSCRFDSGLGHHYFWRNTQVWLKGPVLKTGRSRNRRRGSNPFSSATFINIAGWSNLVARWAHNPEVVGSNPAPATMVRWCSGYHARLSRERSRVQVPYEPPLWLHSSVGRAQD